MLQFYEIWKRAVLFLQYTTQISNSSVISVIKTELRSVCKCAQNQNNISDTNATGYQPPLCYCYFSFLHIISWTIEGCRSQNRQLVKDRRTWIHLLLRPRRNRRHFADDIFKCIFLNENEWVSLRISLKFFPKVRINNIPSLVQIMSWRRSGDKPLSEPMMVSLPTHIYVTRPQWVNAWNTFNQWFMSSLLKSCEKIVLFLFAIYIWSTDPLSTQYCTYDDSFGCVPGHQDCPEWKPFAISFAWEEMFYSNIHFSLCISGVPVDDVSTLI